METYKTLTVFTDGGARGNPGPAAIGVVVRHEQTILTKFAKVIGVATNNVAEYQAVIDALEWLLGRGIKSEKILFHLDSRLVVEQLSGRFKIKNGDLQLLRLRIKILERQVGSHIYYLQIPRSKNWEADILLNQALDASTTSSDSNF